MNLIGRLLATPEYTPEELGCDVLRRCDEPIGNGRRDVKSIILSLETRDEIVAALLKDGIEIEYVVVVPAAEEPKP
jgi:hypothetical protein